MSETESIPAVRTGRILAATIGASAMAFIDGSIVQIALPALQRDLQADVLTLQWVVTVYALLLGALVLVGGSLGDAVGRKRVFLAGTVLFVAGSALCGMAWSAGSLIAFRAVQGLGAALMVPQSLAIIAAVFPDDQRGRAIGTWSGASALTTALGPPLGGLLVDHLSWRAAFLVNVPIGVVVLWLAVRDMPESRAPGAGAIDYGGGLLATVSLGALTWALVGMPERGVSDPLLLASVACAIIAGGAFLKREATADAPMMPLGLFRDPVFSGINAATVLLYGALSGALFIVPYALISLRGFGAAEAGIAMLPLGILIGVLSRPFGALADRIGARLPMAIGSFVVALSLVWAGLTGLAGNPWLAVGGPMVLLALGMSAVVAPLTSTVMGSVPAGRSGVASGINNAAARTAGLLAVALTTALTAAVFAIDLGGQVTTLLAPEQGRALLAGADRLLDAPVPAGLPAAQAALVREAMQTGFERALAIALWMNAGFAALAALVCLVLPLREPAVRA